MEDRMLLGVAVFAATALLGLVGVAMGDVHPPGPIKPQVCPATSACGYKLCGGAKGCNCVGDPGLEVCEPVL